MRTRLCRCHDDGQAGTWTMAPRSWTVAPAALTCLLGLVAVMTLAASQVALPHAVPSATVHHRRRLTDLDTPAPTTPLSAAGAAPEAGTAAPRITIVSVCLQSGKLSPSTIDMSVDNKQRYADRWGYELVVAREPRISHPDKRWEKPALLAELLPTREWLLWMDCDALIMNWDISLESVVAEYADAVPDEHRPAEAPSVSTNNGGTGPAAEEGSPAAAAALVVGASGDGAVDIVMSRDVNAMNSGVFLIRNTEWSKSFLDRVNTAGQAPNPDELLKLWGDQGAMIHILSNDEDGAHVRFVAQEAINSYPPHHDDHYKRSYRAGHFIVHQPDCYLQPLCTQQFRMYYQQAIMMNEGVASHLAGPLAWCAAFSACVFGVMLRCARRRKLQRGDSRTAERGV